MSEQKVYFDNGSTQVTESMVKDGPNSYPIHNINSIKLQSEDLPWIKSAFIAFFGINFLGMVLTGVLANILGNIASLGIFGSLGLACYTVYKIFKGPHKRYYVTLSTSSGEVRAFVSTNPEGPTQISDAIGQSLSDRARRAA